METMELSNVLTVVLTLIVCSQAQLVNFTNPILDTPVTHPSILKVDDWYYLTITANQNTEIHVLKSHHLTNFRYVEKQVIYKVNVGYSAIEAPRMQQLDGHLYMYFSMRNETVSHRMYVMKALNPLNPMGKWDAPIRLLENIWSLTSIHGTVMQHNDSNYFVWTSLHPVADTRQLYIASMASPAEVLEPIVSLRQPTESWECHGACTNEYPSFIYNIGSIYMVFSASSYNHPDHCLSYLKIESGRDPMDPLNWQASGAPVFTKNDEEGVYSTGHSSFTNSPDNMETWMVYHGSDSSTEISGNRLPRIEKIEFDFAIEDPSFPPPHGFNHPQPRPTGEPEMFTNPIIDEESPHPSVIRLGDYYYLTFSTVERKELVILKSPTLTNFRGAEKKVIYNAPEGYQGIRCSKLHLLDGSLYIYFGMQFGNDTHRPYVISALDPADPMGAWSDAKRILHNIWEGTFVFGSVLSTNDRLYFVWSNYTTVGNERATVIDIAQMENPGEVAPPIVRLRHPKDAWECVKECSNDAPTFMYNDDMVYLIFTAGSGSDTNHSLSYMSIESGTDPMDVSNWLAAPGPVFTRNDAEGIYAPINAGFTTSPDGSETWMIYHASNNVTHPSVSRISRVEKIEWDADGTPIFPRPHGQNNPQPIPTSGMALLKSK